MSHDTPRFAASRRGFCFSKNYLSLDETNDIFGEIVLSDRIVFRIFLFNFLNFLFFFLDFYFHSKIFNFYNKYAFKIQESQILKTRFFEIILKMSLSPDFIWVSSR
ncbi:hypothetical protein OMAG_002253 [Candidatus Omnitrophus magneticus]|uniref:Uncharacterized protein n=1 Tax=Candidatus Omnitrophus magneticus TaxID=1609969 RepID=A0A0F0CKN0_9BACT|nr:hypothetical protein OMAG_002253 [Candidatus Omnitrophus magneticus]